MEENRRNIIVKEIQYWKQSHMLPEQYCNYLLALYTEGAGQEPVKNSKASYNLLYHSIASILLLTISVYVIHFTELSFILQMAFLITACFVGAGITYYYIQIGIIAHLSIIMMAIILLLGTVETVTHYSGNEPWILYSVVVFNCVLWIATGKKLKLSYLFISGIAGCILILFSMFI